MSLFKGSLKYPQVTLVLTALAFLVGIQALLHMPRREDPVITIRSGLVYAAYPGATAEQVEEQVTKKIEEVLFRFAEVRKRKTFSTSRPGLVIVNVELEEWVKAPDEFWSKLRHELNVLRQTSLPEGVHGPNVNTDFGDTVAMLIAFHGERYGPRELKGYVEVVEDELRSIPAVSKLKRFGEQKEQIEVSSSHERLAQYGLELQNVVGSLRAQNVIADAGAIDAGQAKVRLRTTGLFQSEEQVRRQIVDISPQGQPVRIGDVATVRRRYQDPEALTRVDGTEALFLSIEMQRGYNIVDFGRHVEERLHSLRRRLPPDLELTVIANQPEVVDERIAEFMREFGMAIGSVILVTMFLLPLQVATIAALAIPVTVAVTFGTLNAVGIELHQVSLAALIVVLGMVVDDAIVIADNYVELLDHGVPRWDAAWRSASEMAIPVLTATLTIIASFLPLAFLSGATGEFILALPITVAVALACSLVVAMLLTPLLCYTFIKKGLHAGAAAAASPAVAAAAPEAGTAGPAGQSVPRRRFNLLDAMQSAYDRTISLAMARRGATMILAAAAFLAGVGLFGFLPNRFFPPAERNQFVVDVWLPEGTRLEATDQVVRRLEARVRAAKEVVHVAAFVGAGAPRFYYNFDPEPSTTNFGQLIVNTASIRATERLTHALEPALAGVAPEARVIVKELQQGAALKAPIEVRLIGPDLHALNRLAATVTAILDSIPGSANVSTDTRENQFGIRVEVDDNVANRVGLSNEGISDALAGSFVGAPVSTFWEGSRAVDIVLRLEESRRVSFDNIPTTYLSSNLTGARVPLREVASLSPEWQPSRIVRRNGLRTITVRSFAEKGTFASAVLEAARPRIAALPLPEGYRVDYGGEWENQKDTFGEMLGALGISVLAIFLILLLQFRNVREPLIVMVSIPLSLFGAVLGLLMTGNPFGMTSFLGMISLTGIVVRNGIILVDFILEQRRKGRSVEEAALEAGKRRLRPIFLTTMAAAVGVTPMILSGSAMWSPLASVLAVGLICSMGFTLIVVPVLYVLWRPSEKPAAEAA